MSHDARDELKTQNVELSEAGEVLERKSKELEAFLAHSIVPLALLDVNLNFLRVGLKTHEAGMAHEALVNGRIRLPLRTEHAENLDWR